MSENTMETEFQPLSLRQKEDFIRKKLIEFGSDTSETGYRELDIRLLHPEVLTWKGSHGPSRLPPQHGRIVEITPDIGPGGRRGKSIIVNFAMTSHITGLNIAKFGLGAVEVNTGDELIIDCSRLESPHGEAQTILPNIFVERSPILVRK